MHEDPIQADDLDPAIRQFQQILSAHYAGHPDLTAAPFAVRRAVAEAGRARWAAGGPEMADTQERRLGNPGARVRIHIPRLGEKLPILVYVHGGGWTLFSLDTHDRLMREYAARAGIAVVGVDYSLAPEHKFPRAIEEIAGVVAALANCADTFGLDGSRIAIGGDSAGANMSVAASLLLRDRGHAMPKAMLLNYGAFDHRPRPSWQRFDGPAYALEAAEMTQFWDHYARTPDDLENPLAVPMLAALDRLPPAFMAIAACDILVDENRAMAERLRQFGVDVDARIYDGATHSFLEAVSIAPLARRALDDSAEWLARRLRAGGDA